MLGIDAEAAQADLRTRPIEFSFPLRPYQKRAIEAVEAALETERRAMLLAMATGTGKTKVSIALLYRLLAAKRFRRVCFVVDRSALGTQAAGEFATTRIVSAKTFGDIFGLKGLNTIKPESETKVHICTIQGLVKRILFNEDSATAPPVDQYDLMVVDECHRGYLLDREMSDAELSFRSQDDYVSKYRRVLEYFDAVKIGLTATPALHTVDIFGLPIFTYSYREAVIDGFLIDHDPPLRITTALAQSGIRFKRGDEVKLIDTRTGAVDLALLPDDVQFDVEEFNKKVVTVAFNRTVADELARHIDPNLPGKTLIFAVNDAHADIVVEQVKNAFREAYGEIEDGAVRKITGSVDRVGDLIRSFRNDTMPKIAVTVDLLTTGIDVPKIENLVFLRRVNSRILYEQMLGRATRQCPEIGKETFRIFDAVDLYPHLQNLTAMKPVVIDPAITLEQLPEKLPWRCHLVQRVAERLRASSEVGENPGAISVLVIGGAGVCVVYSMSQGVVEQGGDLACGCGHRFGLADACGQPSIEGAQRRLRATDGHRGQPQQRGGSAAGSPRSGRKHLAPEILLAGARHSQEVKCLAFGQAERLVPHSPMSLSASEGPRP